MVLLRQTINEIIHDIPSSDVSVKVFISNYLFNPSFRLLLNYRIGKYFYRRKTFLHRIVANYFRVKLMTKRNCCISYNSKIGKNILIPHPIGIVIGDGVVIKDNVTIFQQVTIGSHGKKDRENKYPVIESGVKIFAGAKIIGNVIIGENSIIGANAVVLHNVPSNTVAVGVPARIKPLRE